MMISFHSLAIFVVIFVPIKALEDNWSLTSPDGLTTCNYTYRYRKDRDYDGNEEAVSDSFECGEGSATCTSSLRYNKTFMTHLSGDGSLDPRNSENVIKRVDLLARSVGINYQNARVKDGTFSCTINPGYRVQIVTKPRFHRLTGTMSETCITDSCDDCAVSLKSVPLKIAIPVKSSNDDRIAGSIRCKTEPAANIQGFTRICDDKKLVPGKQFDAVGDALHKASMNAAFNGVKTLEHTNIEGNDVWAIGMCWNGLSKDACRACTRFLVDAIWSECENSKGAQLWVTDCGVRYSFTRLTDANFEDSFIES